MNPIHRLLAGLTFLLALFVLPAAHGAPGDVDPLDAAVVGDGVFATAVQPDGKTIIAGEFSSVLGQPRNNIARLNADGTLDTGFNPNADSSVFSVAVEADGRILLGGSFTTVGGTVRNRIARVDAAGLLEAGFNPDANNRVFSVTVQVDGRILLGGAFNWVGGATRHGIARVDAAGLVDAGFNPNVNGYVFSMAEQVDTRILLGGHFTSVGGATRNFIARVDAAGLLDEGFKPNANNAVNSVAVEADGRILLGGTFTTVGGTARNRIARVDAAGLLDPGFNPNANSSVLSVAMQADGRILLGGDFTTMGGTARNRIARVNAAGLLDAGFHPEASGGVVLSVAVEADGRILLGGRFTSVGGTARNRFAQLVNEPATQTLSAPNATQVIWTRGGSSPEVSQVMFEKSTDGGATWTPLGIGTRIGTTPDWQLTGLSLSGPGQLRARGRTSGGYGSRSSGLVETTANYSFAVVPTVTPSTTNLRTTATIITITGTNFSPAPAQNTVVFTPAGEGTVTASTATSLTVTSLTGLAPGALSAVVVTNGASSGAPEQVATVVLSLPGDIDPLDAGVAGHAVLAMAVQPDGKTIIAGVFTSVLGQPRNNIARLNADGTLDASFNPNVDGVVNSVAVEADGRILLGGAFNNVGGTSRKNIARVDAAGLLDEGFNPNANDAIYSVAVQTDGRILLGGLFTGVGGIVRNRIARVDAAGLVDAGFNPDANDAVFSVAVQADGRVLLGGYFTSVGGTARNYIARVDAAGLPDAGFNPNANGTVYSVMEQADGRILLGGTFTTVGGIARNNIARVDAAGVLETGFNPDANNRVLSVTVQVDGRIVLGGDFTTVGGIARNNIARVDAAGLLDEGFTPNANDHVFGVAVQADGRILLGGWFTTVGGSERNYFARLVNEPAIQTLSAPDATQVTWTRGGSSPEVSQVTFEKSTDSGATWTPLGSGNRIGTTSDWQLSGLSLTGPGQLRARGRTTGGYLTGSFGLVEASTSFNFPPPIVTPSTANLLTTATTLTITGTNFSPLPGQNTVAFTPAGTGLVTASTTTTLTVTSLTGHTLGALNAVVTTNGFSSGAPVQVATVGLPVPGGFDPLNLAVVGRIVLATAEQPDGKTIIAGGFSSVLGVERNNIARLNADGTLDAGFNPNANGEVLSVAVQSDGMILLGGWFNSVGGTVRRYIARVNADGVLDTGFNLSPNNGVSGMAVQSDGKILFGGGFNIVGGIERSHIARVDADGTIDAGFNPNADGSVLSVAVQSDGRILLWGWFTSVGGITRNFIARVSAAGVLDAGFNVGLNPNESSYVYNVTEQADGRFLLGGWFTSVGGTVRNCIARVNSAGALDGGFDPNLNGVVYSVAVQTDGKILFGGAFTTVGGVARNRIARVDAAGVLDTGFNAGLDPTAANLVYSVAEQADGRILLGGDFTRVGGTARNRFARLFNDPATQTLDAPTRNQVTWTRGGSSPEVSQVTFEKSSDSGATWTPLGSGTRIGGTPNWQLTGLSLTGAGQFRARGRTTSGYNNGSSGLIEQVASFNFYTPFQQWKLTHLGDANEPDDGDTDFDGLPTVLEYATGGDPDVAGPLPVGSTVEGRLAITFPRNTAATDVSFTVQGSDDLSTWTDLARSTAGAPMVALDVGVNVVETGAGVLRTVAVRDLFLTADPAHPRRYLRLRGLP